VEVGKDPPSGYAVESLSWKEKDITVYGPPTYLDELDFYSGIKLDLSNVTKDQKIRMPISIQNPIIKVEPKEIDIYVKMVPSKTRTIDHIPIQIAGVGDGLNAKFVQPQDGKISITLSGAPSIIDKMNDGDVKAYCDLTNLTKGKHEIPIQFNLPPYLKVENLGTQKANIELIEK
jgi:YbbR domain-containing protein